MKYTSLFLLLALFGGTWRLGHPTCVLESEFGFVLNCAFKKSGLFRVRNLGGIKAHVGLGFSLGDELGFKESLSNVETETNRRRSVQGSSRLQGVLSQAQQPNTGKSIPIRPSPMSPTVQSMTSGMIPSSKPSQMPSIPPFRPIPPAPERPSIAFSSNGTRRIGSSNIPTPALVGVVPSFNALPPSISRFSAGPTVTLDGKKSAMTLIVPIGNKSQVPEKLSSSNFALRTLPSPNNNELAPILPQTTSNSIQALSVATNISAEAIEAALIMRQQQLLQKKAAASTTTTTTFKPPPAAPTRHVVSRNKVMNAPKEYYPVGYDKNFDDNFASRVDLPETSFYCGDQKHFPGLYADEDLGCMVFHVCALTDDGLIMKSFLCPESTLFDQTILKCNWWFYVECKTSKKLYDSNIPVSKSYQLMKALTFFSSYKNEASTQKPKGKD